MIGNYIDDYDGFDRDGDGYGDVSYAAYAYADRLYELASLMSPWYLRPVS